MKRSVRVFGDLWISLGILEWIVLSDWSRMEIDRVSSSNEGGESVEIANLFLDQVGEVALTLVSDSLSWKLIESLDKVRSSCYLSLLYCWFNHNSSVLDLTSYVHHYINAMFCMYIYHHHILDFRFIWPYCYEINIKCWLVKNSFCSC